MDTFNLSRFIEAQKMDYQLALSEVKNGRKLSHWIWYIFPQLQGLGRSDLSHYYGITNRAEAEAYISNKQLNDNIREITTALLSHDDKTALDIFGPTDEKKVRSSMTLFDIVSPNDIYAQVLDKFYRGKRCRMTLNSLRTPATVEEALRYIGVDVADFELKNSMFTRPNHAPIHGIGHIYRTMLGCALIGASLQRPREGLLAFCGAYIHDLARETDGCEPSHGAKAVAKHFPIFEELWEKYQLTEDEKEMVKQAVIQHSGDQWMKRGDKGYDVMAILKDADALDRCRLGDLNPQWLRYIESKLLIKTIEGFYLKTYCVNEDMDFSCFVKIVV